MTKHPTHHHPPHISLFDSVAALADRVHRLENPMAPHYNGPPSEDTTDLRHLVEHLARRLDRLEAGPVANLARRIRILAGSLDSLQRIVDLSATTVCAHVNGGPRHVSPELLTLISRCVETLLTNPPHVLPPAVSTHGLPPRPPDSGGAAA